ncbi:MAG: hypothetical protein HC800_16340 [Phormidesmis sp. RL_2_1]|nr:hypothetical protein [Phormidesmis sp. RL_2_1]
MRILLVALGALTACALNAHAGYSQANAPAYLESLQLKDSQTTSRQTTSRQATSRQTTGRQTTGRQATGRHAMNRVANLEIANGRGDLLVPSPLERPPGKLFNVETANQLPAGALALFLGTHQPVSDDSLGTGSQLYYARIEQGITDNCNCPYQAKFMTIPRRELSTGNYPTSPYYH